MINIYAKRFLAPIDQITQQIKLVRQGNLSGQELITGQDEFGMLADEFRRMRSACLSLRRAPSAR